MKKSIELMKKPTINEQVINSRRKSEFSHHPGRKKSDSEIRDQYLVSKDFIWYSATASPFQEMLFIKLIG
jgi:hypothetical protein